MNAYTVMTREVFCLAPADDLAAAHALMRRRDVRHLPVLEDGRLVGIVSDRDVLLRATLGPEGLVVPSVPVSTAMTPAPVVCRPDSRIADVARLMLEHKIDALPVLDATDELVGLVTSTDLLALLRDPDDAGAQVIPFDFRLRREVLAAASA